MTNCLVPDHGTPKTGFLPFASGDLDRSGLRLTRAEFARFLGVSKQAVGEWVTAGKITLGTDGRLDPRQAVSQLLRNSDPSRLRARVLAPLMQGVGTLQKRVAELETELARWKEEAEFHEGASMELAGQVNGLHRRLRQEHESLAALSGSRVIGAILGWLTAAEQAAGDPGLAILDCSMLPDGNLAAMNAEADRQLGESTSLPGALEEEEGEDG